MADLPAQVVFSLNNFDLVVIFKDYRRKVVNINAIPMKSLEGIKEWLGAPTRRQGCF